MSPLSLSEIASRLEVSRDTLRNWQRLGVVNLPISECDVEELRESLIAQGKLSSRANKLYKKGVQGEVTHWSQYESSLEEAHRNREGIYYTPTHIIADMLSTIPPDVDLSQKLFLDPCCGSGNFLVEALNMGFRAENIYGFDIDHKAVSIAQKRVEGANIECRNFLDIANNLTPHFDYIYTNPPWGRRIEAEQRHTYATSYQTPPSADSTALFWMAARGVLRSGGVMGFLVQEAVFNVGVYEWFRGRILSQRVISLKDYGRPFRGLLTRAQSVVVEGRGHQPGDICVCSYNNCEHSRTVESFAQNPKTVINFWTTDRERRCIERVFNTPHKTLKGHAKWGLGVVTGDNRRYCSPHQNREFSVGVVRGCDISHGGGIQPPTQFISGELSRYQQSAPREIYEAEEKLVYKFISKRIVVCVDRQQRYLLNSANCIVVDRDLGLTSDQVAELLNSDVINWIFERLFRSHKVLRSDVEMLPLHVGYFDTYTHFDEDTYCQYLGIERCGDGYSTSVAKEKK